MNVAPASCCTSLAAAAQGAGSTVAQDTVVKSSTVQSTDISISTADGDTITISASSRLDGTFSTYEQLARGAGSATLAHGSALSIEAGRQFSISVAGNLNHREIQDIRRALHYIDKAARELLSGDADGAQEKLQGLDKLKTLSTIGANVQVRNSLSVEQQPISA